MTAITPTDNTPGAPVPRRSLSVAPLDNRLLIGLVGVLLASLLAGLNGSVVSAASADVLGAFSLGHDQSRWLSAIYHATEVAAMAFAPWCAVTFSIRRFTLFAIAGLLLLGLLCPLAPNFAALLMLRGLQGLMAGCLPPLLMTVALRFLPPKVRVFGLAGYALTATFGPNLSIPLAALWTHTLGWQWLFWQVLPTGLISMVAVAWGLPQDPLRLERLRKFNCLGLFTGLPAICSIVVGLLQGDWLGWFHSPLISGLLLGGGLLLVLFFINESQHPSPFFGLGLLRRRNFTHALVTLAGTLIVFSATFQVSAGYLATVQGYRPLQSAPVALLIALPQLVLLPLVAAICNRRWVDCRWTMALGLGFCVLSLLEMTGLNNQWSRENFYQPMAMQMLGEPMVVVSLLLSSTSVVHPTEGPMASAWFNTVKSFSAVLGASLMSILLRQRGETHMTLLADQLGRHSQGLSLTLQHLLENGLRQPSGALSTFVHQLAVQATVLAAADIYRIMALLALVLILGIPVIANRVLPPSVVPSQSKHRA